MIFAIEVFHMLVSVQHWQNIHWRTLEKEKNVKNVSPVSNGTNTRSVVKEGQSSSNTTLVPTVEPTIGDYVGGCIWPESLYWYGKRYGWGRSGNIFFIA